METRAWDFNENEVIGIARQLGIKLTSAELGTAMCQAWADRVLDAKAAFDDGRMERCQEVIADANAYAI